MSIRKLFRRAVLPVYEDGFKRRKVFSYLRKLERSQWLTPAELNELRAGALTRLLYHAWQNCPYYRHAWEQAGIHPRYFHDLSDLSRWPLLDRDTIRANRLAMRAHLPDLQLYTKSTGGSTGVPLQFELDSDSNDRRMAAWYRGYGWAGAEPGSKQFLLWSVNLTRRSRWHDFKDRLYNRLYRRFVVSTFGLSEASINDYLARLNACRPDVIVGFTQSLYIFARCLAERGLKPFSPASIVVGAEKLFPFQRRLIEQVFEAPVFETYGSREFTLIGAECDRHHGLHLTDENLIVEVVDENGEPARSGQEGAVVITDLHNLGMPFIRYLNGDRAIAGNRVCACGRGLSLLDEVVGRQTDTIHTPDGRHISGTVFPHLVKDFAGIRRFVVIQDEPDHLEFRIVSGPQLTDSDKDALRAGIENILGPHIHLDLRLVDHIPLTASGKQPVVVSCLTELPRSFEPATLA